MTESVPSAIGFVHDNASQVKEEERHQEGPHTEEVSDTQEGWVQVRWYDWHVMKLNAHRCHEHILCQGECIMT